MLRNWQMILKTKRPKKAEQSAKRKSVKWKKKRVEPAAVHRGTRFVSNPAIGNTASSGVQILGFIRGGGDLGDPPKVVSPPQEFS